MRCRINFCGGIPFKTFSIEWGCNIRHIRHQHLIIRWNVYFNIYVPISCGFNNPNILGNRKNSVSKEAVCASHCKKVGCECSENSLVTCTN